MQLDKMLLIGHFLFAKYRVYARDHNTKLATLVEKQTMTK